MTRERIVGPPHYDDAQLIGLLDGQLTRHTKAAIEKHLVRCWVCRGRLKAEQDNIDAFLRLRENLMPPEIRPSESAVKEFRRRLEAHAHLSGTRPSIWNRIRSEWNRSMMPSKVETWNTGSLRLRPLTIATLITLIAMLFLPVQSPISADTILQRAGDLESLATSLPDRFLRSDVHIERVDLLQHSVVDLGTVELTKDTSRSLVHFSGKTSNKEFALVIHDSGAIAFSGNTETTGLLDRICPVPNWYPDVSIAAYRRLISYLRYKETALTCKSTRFEVHHSIETNPWGIAGTYLVVERITYAPTQIGIVYTPSNGRHEELRFERTAFSRLRTSTELTQLFSSPKPAAAMSNLWASNAPSTPNISAEPVVSKPASPHRFTYFNSKASDAEVQVALALHRAGACLGEEIHIYPMSDGSILVQGLVDRPERKEEISQAVHRAGVPGTRVEIAGPFDAKSDADIYDPPDRLPETTHARVRENSKMLTLHGVSNGLMPLYDFLFDHFSKQLDPAAPRTRQQIFDQVTAFCDDVISRSNEALFHTWALKKLDVEFSGERIGGLGSEQLDTIGLMRRDHREEVGKVTDKLLNLLEGIAGVKNGEQISQPALEDCDSLLAVALAQNELARKLFTASSAVPGSAAEDLGRLQTLLQRLRRSK